MPQLDRIALQRRRARLELERWTESRLVLPRPLYFVPGWTDESGSGAWARFEPWIEAVCKNADRRAHFVRFVSEDGEIPPPHEDFMGFAVDLARRVHADPEASMLGADFVCHSMGGLDAFAAIALLEDRAEEKTHPICVARRVITLDTPFRGFAAADSQLFRMMVRAHRPRDPHILAQLRAMREDSRRIAEVWRARDRFLGAIEGLWLRGADNTGGLIEVPHESASFGSAADFEASRRPRYRGYRAWEDTSHSGTKGVTADPRVIVEVLNLITR